MLYAFFDRHDQLDPQGMRRQVKACVDNSAQGVAVLGLGTEVSKLSDHERRTLVEWVADELAGRLPMVVTVNAPNVEAQVEFARFARRQGAAWVILQPPPGRNLTEEFLIRFFGAVADQLDFPVAIQNAPEYLGVGLRPEGINTLRRQHPNFQILKGEGPAMTIRRFVEATDGELPIFNGRGGLELTDNLRAGCAGMIPAVDTVDVQTRIYRWMRDGAEEEAEAAYRTILPAIAFVMQSLETLHTYGKRLTAQRLGLGTVYDRQPGLPVETFGMQCVQRFARQLGSLN